MIGKQSIDWSGKALLRIVLLLLAAAAIAAFASRWGIASDLGYLRASILAGIPDGQYYRVATRLAARADREHGKLNVIATSGSIDNITRLLQNTRRCAEPFAFVQDGTPVSAEAGVELLGRLPESELLLLLARRDRAFTTFHDLEHASIGVGPEGSGSSYLIRELFMMPDLESLNVKLSNHALTEQAELVADRKLDVAAMVMREDAELLRHLIQDYNLEIVAPDDLEGLLARHAWLGHGRIPAGYYDVVHNVPSKDRTVARIDTLVLVSRCAPRAERIAMLMLLAAELPGFIGSNPPRASGSSTVAPLAIEASQFFQAGEPQLADRYFPWLVNILSPAYWVYLVMAVTVLFNALKGYSRFRLWRIDACRQRLKSRIDELKGGDIPVARSPARGFPSSADRRAFAQGILQELTALRARCQRQAGSFVTPMGDEMFYRYQESLITEAMTYLRTDVG